jgi:hypothetical protein
MWLRNKESQPPQAEGHGPATRSSPPIPECPKGAGPESTNTGRAYLRIDPYSGISGLSGGAPDEHLGAELHQTCAVEAVDAVILAEMAWQSPQVSLRGDPFGIRTDLVGFDLAPLDRYTGVEQ